MTFCWNTVSMRYVVLRYVTLRYVKLCRVVVLCCAVLPATLCCDVLCYVVLCYVSPSKWSHWAVLFCGAVCLIICFRSYLVLFVCLFGWLVYQMRFAIFFEFWFIQVIIPYLRAETIPVLKNKRKECEQIVYSPGLKFIYIIANMPPIDISVLAVCRTFVTWT